ncbi:MAG TPA: AAA family ATPase [Burkholderiaceae bacterium]
MTARPGAPAEPLYLQLLDMPALRVGPLLHPLQPKDAALLALLALEGARARAKVASLLWPDAAPKGAHNNLRQRLFRLRRTAGREVVVNAEAMALAPDVQHDLMDLRASLLADAGAASGELLGTHDYSGDAELALWVAGARERWRAARREILAAQAEHNEREQRLVDALAYAERLVRDEPLLEHAQRRLMRLHYSRGDRGAALAVYERLKAALDNQLGETPSAETQQLVSLIEAAIELPVARPPAPASVLRPPRLIGRDSARATLDSAWRERRLALVRGEAGIGKSRLLEDFAASRGGALQVRARPGDERVPYALLTRFLRALLERADASQLAPSCRADLAFLLPEIADAESARAKAAPLARLCPAIERLLQAAAPAGVVIDDLHFADAATLETLASLVAAADLPWLLAVRGAEVPPVLQAWLDQQDARRWCPVDLGPLSIAQTRALLESLQLPGFDSASWAPRLHSHSGGNPMFMLETLLAVLRTGALLHDAAQALPIPGSVGQLITRRLERLSSAALRLARVIAFAGQDFDVDLAAAVLECHPLDLAPPWHELQLAHVTNDGAPAHDLVQQALQLSTPPDVARWLHARIAGRLDACGGVAARRAHHWREAGAADRAAECFLLAAEGARRAGRRADECSLLDAAAQCFHSAGLAAKGFDAALLAVIASREVESLVDAARRATDLFESARGPREQGLAAKELAVCRLQAANLQAATEEFDRALALLQAAGETHHGNHVRYLSAMASVHLRGAALAVAELEALEPWADALTDRDLAHAFGNDFAIALDLADQRQRAQVYFERSIVYFDAMRDPADAAAARMMLGRSLLLRGQGDRALALLEAALRDRQLLADGEGGQGVEALHLGRAYGELGRYADALRLLDPLCARLASASPGVLHAGAALAQARAFIDLGQVARAGSVLAGVSPTLPHYLQAAALWTRSMLAGERRAERRDLLAQALSCFASVDLASVRLPIEADALLFDGDTEVPERRYGRLLEESVARELPAAGLLVRLRWMQRLLMRNELQATRPILDELVDSLTRLTTVGAYRPEFEWTCHRAARALGDDALAARSLDAALAWIERCAREQVSAEFRSGFTQRNPVNRAVLAAAGRL